MSKAINDFLATTVERAQSESEKAIALKAKYSETSDADVKRDMQRAETHSKYNTRMSEISEKALAVVKLHKFDASAICSQSRELKKRLISSLEAIAHSDKSKLDKALCSMLAHIVASDKESMTLREIQHAMNHATTTQASYFKNFALFFKFADYDKSDKRVTLKADSAFYKKLAALFD